MTNALSMQILDNRGNLSSNGKYFLARKILSSKRPLGELTPEIRRGGTFHDDMNSVLLGIVEEIMIFDNVVMV